VEPRVPAASATFLLAWRKCAEVRLIRDSALPWLYTVAGSLASQERRGTTRFLRALRRAGGGRAVPAR
jgi:hypothetical protein